MQQMKSIQRKGLYCTVVAVALSASTVPALAAPPQWQPPVYVDQQESADSGLGPKLAVSSGGQALVTWVDSDTQSYWASAYVFGGGWGPPTLLGPVEFAGAGQWDVAMNPNVLGTVVMRSWTPSGSIVARRYSPAGWSSLDPLDPNGGSLPTVAMGPDETAMALWSSVDGALYARRFKGTSWGPAVKVDEPFDGIGNEAVAADPSGNVVAIWPRSVQNQNTFPAQEIRASRFVAGANSWSVPTTLRVCSHEGLVRPHVAMDASGAATAVWQCRDDSTFRVWAARSSAASKFYRWGWGPPVLIDAGKLPDNVATALALNASGAAVAAWTHNGRVHVSRYVVGQGWLTPEPIGFEEGGAIVPDVAIDANGSITVIWDQTNDVGVPSPYGVHDHQVVAQRYVPGAGWQGIGTLESLGGYSTQPHIAADGQGRVIATWRLGNDFTLGRIRAAIFE